jgi:phosphatidylserine/phosphatidylglycerophosphate/cardiolipin synthase-like enzyme
LALLVGFTAPAWAGAAEVYYAPGTRLDAVDVKLIDDAETSIDMAAYVLTDREVIRALCDAEERGVKVRVVMDPREPVASIDELGPLAASIRFKRGGPLMHLKAYAIDGQTLRTGSANFSYSGEREQDNDVVVLRDPAAAVRFSAQFERIWKAAQ